jgi:hypothetical protein
MFNLFIIDEQSFDSNQIIIAAGLFTNSETFFDLFTNSETFFDLFTNSETFFDLFG